MSKMDGLRAMREARFDKMSARAAKPVAASTTPKAPAARPVEVAKAVGDDVAGSELCGHRAISGRTCTRERAHSAKSHRYS
jgi:hypothetical protein